jgi:hypothetical protein
MKASESRSKVSSRMLRQALMALLSKLISRFYRRRVRLQGLDTQLGCGFISYEGESLPSQRPFSLVPAQVFIGKSVQIKTPQAATQRDLDPMASVSVLSQHARSSSTRLYQTGGPGLLIERLRWRVGFPVLR